MAQYFVIAHGFGFEIDLVKMAFEVRKRQGVDAGLRDSSLLM